MKLVMFTLINKASPTTVGVFKKMYGQLKAFTKQGMDCYFLFKDNNYLVLENLKTQEFERRIPQSTLDVYNKALEMILKIAPDFIYIRKMVIDHRAIGFLQRLKIQTNLKIIMEFPTLPYDQEIRGRIIYNIDRHCRKELKKFVDLAVNYNKYDNVFGIPAICIINAVDVENIPVNNSKYADNELHVLAVASLAKWHGYDRLIEGLAEYYRQKKCDSKVCLHIVGEEQTPGILSSWQELVKKYGLQETVIFHGLKKGADLDNLFNQSQIAVGNLGFHRTGVQSGSTIKEQEYCARGMPFINAFENIAFAPDYKYKLTFPSDETPIDIEKVIAFYNYIVQDEDYRLHIRKYAENHLTWEHSLAPVFKWINNNVL